MFRRSRSKSMVGAVATGAAATGAASFAVMSAGAVALGALAVGALAIGRLTVGRARLQRVDIGHLAVGRLELGTERVAGSPTAVCRIRSAPGRGDELERLVLAEIAAQAPEPPHYQAHRSQADPDRFLFYDARIAAPRRAGTAGLPASARFCGRLPRAGLSRSRRTTRSKSRSTGRSDGACGRRPETMVAGLAGLGLP